MEPEDPSAESRQSREGGGPPLAPPTAEGFDPSSIELAAPAVRAPSIRPAKPSYRPPITLAPMGPPPEALQKTFVFDSPLANTATIPVALGLALVLHVLGMGSVIFSGIGMWTHELGHATTAWLSGFLAIPVPFMTALFGDGRSWFVIVLVLAAWVALGIYGWNRSRYRLVAGAVAIGVAQLVLTGVMSPGRAMQWVIFAGMGGEIVVATVFILAFYEQLPIPRWDFWRYPVAVTAALSYVHALLLWVGHALGLVDIGLASSSGHSAQGDLALLLRTNEFTERGLSRFCLTLAIACGAVIVASYVVHLIRARRIADA